MLVIALVDKIGYNDPPYIFTLVSVLAVLFPRPSPLFLSVVALL